MGRGGHAGRGCAGGRRRALPARPGGPLPRRPDARPGAWETHIAETLANLGLPAELAVLPHVESSFNPTAYSKVGAAGLWQFMRSTGRRYMRIDRAVDDRLDPFRSTEAAAQLLAYNYRLLGTWPLALTAYNHGTEGVRRAKEQLGTDDIARIVRDYHSPQLRLRLAQLLCVVPRGAEIDRNPEKYFGALQKEQRGAFPARCSCRPTSPSARSCAPSRSMRDTLRELNPALLPSVWNGQQRIPKAYRLRLPQDGTQWSAELLAQRLAPVRCSAGSAARAATRWQQGDTLAALAGVYERARRDARAPEPAAHQRPPDAGHVLSVPETTPTLVAAAPAPPPPPAVPAAARPAARQPGVAAVAPPSPGGAVSADVAQRESAEDAAAAAAASGRAQAACRCGPIAAGLGGAGGSTRALRSGRAADERAERRSDRLLGGQGRHHPRGRRGDARALRRLARHHPRRGCASSTTWSGARRCTWASA